MSLPTLLRPLRLLNSVIFGIALMLAIGLYIALGSGLPRLREFFEMDELQFFSAWPLKVLMALMVINLAVVSIVRIPLTPPRYGVWCVHVGIVTLIAGMAWYYNRKVEGSTLVPLRGTATHYYDNTERSLYMRLDGQPLAAADLPSLPRFATYTPQLQNADRLLKPDLLNIVPRHEGDPAKPATAAPVKLDVVAYYRYAYIQSIPEESESSHAIGVHVTVLDPQSKQPMVDPHTRQPIEVLLSDFYPQSTYSGLGQDLELAHRRTENAPDTLLAAAASVHRLHIDAAGKTADLNVAVGKTYDVPGTPYHLQIERFDPKWSMFGTHQQVKALTMLVTMDKPDGKKQFRRMVLDGQDVQTDFKLEGGGGPMGQRQKEALDRDLRIRFDYSDPRNLIPRQRSLRYTFITTADGNVACLATGWNIPAELRPVAADGATTVNYEGETLNLRVRRTEHFGMRDTVHQIPREQRRGDPEGRYQVLLVRVSSGAWAKTVAVPYCRWTSEAGRAGFVADDKWADGCVCLPGTRQKLELQLGKKRRELPARLTLAKFDLVPYPGSIPGVSNLYRDFRATLQIQDPATGQSIPALAHLNSPATYGGSFIRNWAFYQAEWDPSGQRYTVLGVGNRPGVLAMISGSVIMAVGLVWAFYIKPILNRKRQPIPAVTSPRP